MWYSPEVTVLLACCDMAVLGGWFGDLVSVGSCHWYLKPVGAGAATGRCGGLLAGVAGNGQMVGGRSGGDGTSHQRVSISRWWEPLTKSD